MRLYLVHCGFYDSEICDGLYESHVNYFVLGTNFEEARANAKLLPEFKNKRMHIDGLQEIQAVNGHRVEMVTDMSLNGETRVVSHKHRELAPKPS